jgi:hypothetical protein
LRVFFPSILAAAQAAYAIMASALPVARMELVDELGIQSINLCWLLPSKVARHGCYCMKNALSFSSLPRRSIPLGTSGAPFNGA